MCDFLWWSTSSGSFIFVAFLRNHIDVTLKTVNNRVSLFLFPSVLHSQSDKTGAWCMVHGAWCMVHMSMKSSYNIEIRGFGAPITALDKLIKKKLFAKISAAWSHESVLQTVEDRDGGAKIVSWDTSTQQCMWPTRSFTILGRSSNCASHSIVHSISHLAFIFLISIRLFFEFANSILQPSISSLLACPPMRTKGLLQVRFFFFHAIYLIYLR